MASYVAKADQSDHCMPDGVLEVVLHFEDGYLLTIIYSGERPIRVNAPVADSWQAFRASLASMLIDENGFAPVHAEATITLLLRRLVEAGSLPTSRPRPRLH